MSRSPFIIIAAFLVAAGCELSETSLTGEPPPGADVADGDASGDDPSGGLEDGEEVPCASRVYFYVPVDGETVRMIEDLDSSSPGVQLTVRCRVECFPVRESLVLRVDDLSSFLEGRYTTPYDGSGEVAFGRVMLHVGSPGEPRPYRLEVSGPDGRIFDSIDVGVDF